MKRWMQRNHRTRTPGAIICVDTESFTQPYHVGRDLTLLPFRLGVARYCRIEAGRPTRREILHFDDVAVFWEWCRGKLDERRSTWLWAHNLGWDLTVLRFWQEVEAERFTFVGPPKKVYDRKTKEWTTRPTAGLLVTEDPPTALMCWDKRQLRLKACDTYNWYPHSLKTLGTMVGLEKLDFPGSEADEATLRCYCARDAEIVERLVLELLSFVRRHDLGNFRYTPAAQSLAAFRHLSEDFAVEFTADDDVAEFERLAYYGGRKSVFFAGEILSPAAFTLDNAHPSSRSRPVCYGGPVTQLDLSAAFASVMRKNHYPYQLIYKRLGQSIPEVLNEMRHHGCCAWVQIESLDEPYPVKVKDRTLWCTGSFKTGLCGPELRRALQAGHVQCIYRAFYYRMSELFTDFVDHMSGIENSYPRDSEPVRRELAKTLRNALYGKFGQRETGWEVVPDARWMDPWGEFGWQEKEDDPIERRRAIGYRVQRRLKGPRVAWTFPAISAYVTAYCRERMRALITIAGANNVYYLDTDSIHCSPIGVELLETAGEISQNVPGKLRVVETADTVYYHAPKHYVWDGEEVNAGLNRRAMPAENGRYKVEEFQHLRDSLKNRPPPGGVIQTKIVAAPTHHLCAQRTASGWTVPLVYCSTLEPET